VIAVVVLIALAVIGVLTGMHGYLWRRLVRDTTRAGGRTRRVGTIAVVLLPLTTVGAMVSGRAGAPFIIEQILAWPGYLWLALLLYLTLALVVGEAVRPLLRRFLERRDTARAPTQGAPDLPGAPQAPQAPQAPESRGAPGALGASGVSAARPEGSPSGPPPLMSAARGRGAAGRATAIAPVVRTDADTESGTPQASRLPAGPSRRLFVARTVAAAASAAAVGTVGYGTYGVLRGPEVKRVTVPLAKLPRQAHGFRIAVVSDIHLGPVLGRSHTRRIVETINSTQPDLVAIVGDLVDGSVADLGQAAEPLSRLNARHGSFFVTGNHEYFSGAAQWVDHVRELGVRPLENARTELPAFDLAGVNDVSAALRDPGQGPDFRRALGDRDRSRAVVLLAHQPVMIHDAVDHGVDLQLSGHTHGGQLWPGNYLAALVNPTVAGLERYGATQLYVTRGAGAWGPPVRVGARSDITVLTLASRKA
jgi:hypothetical protein